MILMTILIRRDLATSPAGINECFKLLPGNGQSTVVRMLLDLVIRFKPDFLISYGS